MLKKLILILLILIAPLSTIHAQETPPSVRDAGLAAIAASNLPRPESWRHVLMVEPSIDTTLNCVIAPAGTALPAPVQVYQVWYTINGQEYLYHISADGQHVTPCDLKLPAATSPLPTPIVTPLTPNTTTSSCFLTAVAANIRAEPSATQGIALLGQLIEGQTATVIGRTEDRSWYQIILPTNAAQNGWVASSVSTPTGNCDVVPVTGTTTIDYGNCPAGFASYEPSQLMGYAQGQIEAGGFPNSLRSEPSTSSNRVGEIAPGSIFDILEGPQCGNGIVWWRVSANGLIGWTAETNVNDVNNNPRYIKPFGTRTAPTITGSLTNGTGERISGINLGNLQSLIHVSSTIPDLFPQIAWSPDMLRIAMISRYGVDVYQYPTLALDTVAVQAIDDTLLKTEIRFALPTALTFSPDGRYLAVGTNTGEIGLLDTTTNIATLITTDEHQHPVEALAFNSDGSLLASGDRVFSSSVAASGFSVKLWNMNTLTPQLNLSLDALPVVDLAFTSDGTIAIATASDIRIYQPSGELTRTEPILANSSPTLEPANPTWFTTNSGVIYSSGGDVFGLDSTTGRTANPLLTVTPAQIRHFTQTPTTDGFDVPVIVAQAINSTSNLELVFGTPASNQPIKRILLENMLTAVFSPDGTALAIQTTDALQIWGITSGN